MIVDENGRPFNPSPMQQLRDIAATPMKLGLAEVLEPASKLEAAFKIAQLRESCGAEPGTITFRRNLPY